MNLADPAGLAALGLLVPLVAWYLLKARRRRHLVPSTLVWEDVPRSTTAASPWQRFQPDLTFWLLAAAIVVGAVTLARPYAPVQATLGDQTMVIVDTSGSMSATEGSTTRLEAARRSVLDLVDGLAAGQEVSVIEAGATARILVAGATSVGNVEVALDGLRQQHGTADLADAFTLATALQRAGRSAIFHVVTDREVPPDLLDGRAVSVQPVGAVADNLAVTRLQVVPGGSGTSEVFVALRNWTQQPARARLALTVDGEEVAAEVVDLEPRGQLDRTLTVRGRAGAVVAASVEPVGEVVDALPIDDRAWGLLRSPQDVRVLAVTEGNLFLTAALQAVEGVELEVAATVPDSLAGVDLLVLDRVAAPEPAPAVPTLLVAPPRWPDGIAVGPAVERPVLTSSAEHDLLGAVDLSEVAVAEATPISGADLTPVAGGPDGTLLAAGRPGGTPTVALAFALTDSNLPLTAAWPTLVANTVTWLAGTPASVPAVAGSPVTVPVPPGFDSVLVDPPDGDPVEVSAVAPTLVVDRVGLWRLATGTPAPGSDVDPADVVLPPALVVNPASDEGDLRQAPPEAIAAATTSDDGERTPGRQPLGGWILPAVLALLAGEWWWATRHGRGANRRGAIGPRRRRSAAGQPAPEGSGRP